MSLVITTWERVVGSTVWWEASTQVLLSLCKHHREFLQTEMTTALLGDTCGTAMVYVDCLWLNHHYVAAHPCTSLRLYNKGLLANIIYTTKVEKVCFRPSLEMDESLKLLFTTVHRWWVPGGGSQGLTSLIWGFYARAGLSLHTAFKSETLGWVRVKFKSLLHHFLFFFWVFCRVGYFFCQWSLGYL